MSESQALKLGALWLAGSFGVAHQRGRDFDFEAIFAFFAQLIQGKSHNIESSCVHQTRSQQNRNCFKCMMRANRPVFGLTLPERWVKTAVV